ncbi:MAG: ribonuclease III [Lachnospiraceae bacterium]|nr:ribonuclease III [Lachnospiraceae bacterium]
MEQNTTLMGLVRQTFELPEQDIRTYSPLTLAYIGDAIYDLIIRTMLVEKGNSQVNKLHQRASAMVKAVAQKEIMLVIEPLLTEEERGYYKRGRNAKSYTTAKNASIGEYRVATGFEALLGFLYLTDRMERLMELVKLGVERLQELPASAMNHAKLGTKAKAGKLQTHPQAKAEAKKDTDVMEAETTAESCTAP